VNIKKNIYLIKKEWKRFFGNEPFDYFFLDEFYNNQYKEEISFMNISIFFALIAILLSALGIFGLSINKMQRDTKSMVIRKINGASYINLITIQAKSYFKIISISIILGIPLLFYFMKSWLDNFVQRVDIEFVPFLIAIFIILAISIITISFNINKLARTNPIYVNKEE
jgi:putative ABC transport system permease protein